MKTWTIPFTSLAGVNYEVVVEDDMMTGMNEVLLASDNPFEVKEDDDSDFFTPIRYQSGYFRIVCDNEKWKELIPMGGSLRRVRLFNRDKNRVEWVGFQKSQTFNHSIWNNVDEYEFPIQCPLSVLKDAEWTLASGYNSINDLLREMLAIIDMDDIDIELPNYYLSKYAQGVYDIKTVTSLVISRLQFTEYNNNYVAGSKNPAMAKVWRQKKNPAEVLESICAFFGWTAHIERTKLVMTAADMPLYELSDTYDSVVLDDDGGEKDRIALQPLALEDSDIMDDEAESVITPSHGRIIITADPDETEISISLPTKEQLENLHSTIEKEWGTFWEYMYKRTLYCIRKEGYSEGGPGVFAHHFPNGWAATVNLITGDIDAPDHDNDKGYDDGDYDYYEDIPEDDRYEDNFDYE